MGISSLAGPLIGLGSSAIGSSKGGVSGGLSPQQAALSQYDMGQSILQNSSTAANSGTGASTMSSYADAAAGIGAATQAAGMSDTNAQGQLAENQSLQNLASSAGFGTQGGSFGTQSGNFGSSVDTNPTLSS
jgi:hypothetical protein